MASLLSLLDEYSNEDWSAEELPVVYSMIGAPALPALANFLADDSHGLRQPARPRLEGRGELKRVIAIDRAR